MNSSLLSYENWNQNENSQSQLSHNCFEERYYFCQEKMAFCKKILTSSKLNESPTKMVYFLKLHMHEYLYTKFQFYNIISMSLTQGGIILLPTGKRTHKSPQRLGLNKKFGKMLKYFNISLIQEMMSLLTWPINIVLP